MDLTSVYFYTKPSTGHHCMSKGGEELRESIVAAGFHIWAEVEADIFQSMLLVFREHEIASVLRSIREHPPQF